MDSLEIYAKARDGGPWFQLAAETWSLIAVIVAIIAVILLVIFLSAQRHSVAGKLLEALRPPHADHLFMRVNVRDAKSTPAQVYLASMHPHSMHLYSKFKMEPGHLIQVDPPGVTVAIQRVRPISVDPPWFAIEAEPVFRDDISRNNYRKFLGALSQVA